MQNSTSMNELYTTTSFGGGGSSSGSRGRGSGTLGPGGGSDPGNHQSARTGNGVGTGPLSPRQHNTVTAGLTAAAVSPIGRGFQAAAAIGAGYRGYQGRNQ